MMIETETISLVLVSMSNAFQKSAIEQLLNIPLISITFAVLNVAGRLKKKASKHIIHISKITKSIVTVILFFTQANFVLKVVSNPALSICSAFSAFA